MRMAKHIFIKRTIKLLRNRDFLLMMALLLGLFAGGGARFTERAILPVLAVVMTLATMEVPGKIFLSPGKLIGPILVGLAMNYGILGSFLLGLNALLIHDPNIYLGFIIMAAVPPAVAVIPFTAILRGNAPLSLVATIGCYLGALLIMPVITVTLIGKGFVDYGKLIRILLELILAPLVFSRILIRTNAVPYIEPYKGTIINWSFFVVVYTIVGLNRELFFRQPLSMLYPALIALASTFILGAVIERICRLFRVNRPTRTSLVLLGTHKNTGLSAGLSLALFGDVTAVPSTVSTIFMLVYLIWLSFKHSRYQEMEA